MKKRIVLIRLDKIGDLICTLPVDQVIDSSKYHITWIVQKGLGQVADIGANKRNYIELDRNNPKQAAAELAKYLESIAPDVAISFQAPWWVNFELFKARVPVRSGVKSQWHSFLFLNKGVRQKRSLAEKHEFDYNLELVQKTLRLPPTRQFLHYVILPSQDFSVLNKYNLEFQKFIVVHPGMMGSALNWKQSQYIDFINEQLLKEKKVVITGTDSDSLYLNEIHEQFKNHPNVIWLQSLLNMKELVQVLSQAEFVLAPSTGVAHIAASLGVQVHGIYSPIRVHHPRRWAPRGPTVHVYLPNVKCQASHHCLLQECKDYNCMDKLQIHT